MTDRDDLLAKSEILAAIAEEQIQSPHNIPAAVYAQEAEDLYVWVQDDKEALIEAGLNWELVEDLPVRFGALKAAEAYWNSDRLSRPDPAVIWAKEHPKAYALKKEILHAFRFAFRNRPDLLKSLRNMMSRNKMHSSMIQDLISLEVLGTANADLLEAVRFDMTLLEKASELADEMQRKFAEAINSWKRKPETKNTRDRAYTHLKEAVDEICRWGRFVFRGNKERINGYRSDFHRNRNLKWWKERKKKKAAAATAAIATVENPLPVPPTSE